MKTIRTVFFKEIVDNFRDRRTLVSALLMGPLFGPILFAFVINLSVKQSLENAEQSLELAVIGGEHAPNLVAFLESRNINIEDLNTGSPLSMPSAAASPTSLSSSPKISVTSLPT